MPQLDYASIMKGGQQLVPNLYEQLLQRQQVEAQTQDIDLRRKVLAAKTAEDARTQQREAQFGEAMEYALSTGNPRDMQRVRMLYPEFTKDLKEGFDALDAEQRQTNLTQLGSVRTRLAAGDVAGARAIVARRLEADKAAGAADEDTEELLELLDSGKPEDIELAKGTLTFMLAAVDPDRFAETYGKLEPSDAKVAVQKEYEWRVGKFGQEAADEWLAVQDIEIITPLPGAQPYDKRDFIRRPGAPSLQPGQGEPPVPTRGAMPPMDGPLGPWIEQTAGLTASSRKRATGVPGTYHADDNARDFPTPTRAENIAKGRRLKAVFGPAFDVLYSETDSTGQHDDHVHVEPGPQLGAQVRGRAGANPVRSKQQYDRLPVGAKYLAPDGKIRVKT